MAFTLIFSCLGYSKVSIGKNYKKQLLTLFIQELIPLLNWNTTEYIVPFVTSCE